MYVDPIIWRPLPTSPHSIVRVGKGRLEADILCTNNADDFYHLSPFLYTSPLNQVISASDVALTTRQPRLRTFGWSLTSGVDVDNNEYLGECLDVWCMCVSVCVCMRGCMCVCERAREQERERGGERCRYMCVLPWQSCVPNYMHDS